MAFGNNFGQIGKFCDEYKSREKFNHRPRDKNPLAAYSDFSAKGSESPSRFSLVSPPASEKVTI
jgi:hypothetical protein